MLDSIAKLNRDCYKGELLFITSYDKILSLVDAKPEPPRRLFCKNEKEYAGGLHLYLMRMLLMFREDTKTFKAFLNSITKEKDVSEEFFERLASEMIYLLFTDFTSNERTVLNILRHFEYLIQVISLANLFG